MGKFSRILGKNQGHSSHAPQTRQTTPFSHIATITSIGKDPVIDMNTSQIREGKTTKGRQSAQIHHAVQSQLGKDFLLIGNLDVIDYMALHEIF